MANFGTFRQAQNLKLGGVILYEICLIKPAGIKSKTSTDMQLQVHTLGYYMIYCFKLEDERGDFSELFHTTYFQKSFHVVFKK